LRTPVPGFEPETGRLRSYKSRKCAAAGSNWTAWPWRWMQPSASKHE